MSKERSQAQLEIMREVKSAWAKGYLNYLWIQMEIERLEEEVEEENDDDELIKTLREVGY